MRVLASMLRNMNDPAEGAMFFPSVAGIARPSFSG